MKLKAGYKPLIAFSLVWVKITEKPPFAKSALINIPFAITGKIPEFILNPQESA
ncbi:TPA: hypothetical protein IAA86_06820 [Candidatus Galligastranaerophilus intestinavium]|uniref:Uncharacterized protein n=1 Tax=Candidatus Galligastranaerophilus intestinavium TaxID=2840836 RepID=A0A9D1FIY6_9BACT|nr:hypothetical protein [Candidatus Galligastranaerophilus intestinavium]